MQNPLRLNKAWTISHSKMDLEKQILAHKSHKLPDKVGFFVTKQLTFVHK